MKYIYEAPYGKLFSFSVSVKILDELSKISRRYLCERLEKKYSRMELLSEGPVWNTEKTADPDSGK